jgi:hypothetical protein
MTACFRADPSKTEYSATSLHLGTWPALARSLLVLTTAQVGQPCPAPALRMPYLTLCTFLCSLMANRAKLQITRLIGETFLDPFRTAGSVSDGDVPVPVVAPG